MSIRPISSSLPPTVIDLNNNNNEDELDLDAILEETYDELEREQQTSSSMAQSPNSAPTPSSSSLFNMPILDKTERVEEKGLGAEDWMALMEQHLNSPEGSQMLMEYLQFMTSDEGRGMMQQFMVSAEGKEIIQQLGMNQEKMNQFIEATSSLELNPGTIQQLNEDPAMVLRKLVSDYEKDVDQFTKKMKILPKNQQVKEMIVGQLSQLNIPSENRKEMIKCNELEAAFFISMIHAVSQDKTCLDHYKEFVLEAFKKEENPGSLLELASDLFGLFKRCLPSQKFELFKKNMGDYLLKNIHML